MKQRTLWSALVLSVVLFPAGAALAEEVFSVWASGTTIGQATDRAKALGANKCANAGYTDSWFEFVDTVQAGTNHIVYGLTTCF